MTTIAYKDGLMASDSCWTLNNSQVTSLNKITRLKSGGLLGQAGDNDSREIVALLDTIKHEKNVPFKKALLDLRVDYTGLWVLPSGKIYIVTARSDPNNHDEEVGFTPISRRIAAVGSGNEFALGAMRAGATAREAVFHAAEFDIYTRAPVHVVRLNPLTRTKKARTP